MAFIPYAYQSGVIAPWVWLPAGDAAWTVGQAAIIASGKCEPVASGTGQDTDEGVHYIAMFDETIAAANDGAVRPFLLAATSGLVFETTLGAVSGTPATGIRYTLHTDGKSITDTATKGVFVIIESDGMTLNDKVRGYFVDALDALS